MTKSSPPIWHHVVSVKLCKWTFWMFHLNSKEVQSTKDGLYVSKMDLILFLFVSFSDWRFAISNKVFEWINPSDSRDIWNCECQIIIDGLTPYKTHVLYITRISICGCHRTHSTQTNEATAMGNVKVDYDFQLEKTKKEMTYYGSSRIRPSFTSLVCLFVIVFS